MIWAAIILALGLVPFATARGRPAGRAAIAVPIVWMGLVLAVAWGRALLPSTDRFPEQGRPVEVLAEAFEGSGACQACHPGEYATWYASYHRTMTQLALPDVVRGGVSNGQVHRARRTGTYRLEQRAATDSTRTTGASMMTTGFEQRCRPTGCRTTSAAASA